MVIPTTSSAWNTSCENVRAQKKRLPRKRGFPTFLCLWREFTIGGKMRPVRFVLQTIRNYFPQNGCFLQTLQYPFKFSVLWMAVTRYCDLVLGSLFLGLGIRMVILSYTASALNTNETKWRLKLKECGRTCPSRVFYSSTVHVFVLKIRLYHNAVGILGLQSNK